MATGYSTDDGPHLDTVDKAIYDVACETLDEIKAVVEPHQIPGEGLIDTLRRLVSPYNPPIDWSAGINVADATAQKGER